jgi:hypothetical protein
VLSITGGKPTPYLLYFGSPNTSNYGAILRPVSKRLRWSKDYLF